MGEVELFERFLRGELDAETFDHRSHLAVGWVALGRETPQTAERQVCEGIRALAVAAGAASKFNLTLTVAFMRLIAGRGREENFDAFLMANSDLVSEARTVLARHYSTKRLFCDTARSSWLPPDLDPLPRPV